MARIRTIKPEFPQSESMGRVSRDARLLFIMLWTIADDEGRARAASRMLASLLYPYDDDAPHLIDDWIGELVRERCLYRYEVDGNTYLEITKWLKHQKIDRPSKSRLPAPNEPSRTLANIRETSSLDLVPRTEDQEEDSCTKPSAVALASALSQGPLVPNQEAETETDNEHETRGDEPLKPARARIAYSKEFEAFWAAYPTDALMSKKLAFEKWQRLSADDRDKATSSVPAFCAYCRQHSDYRPVHAERYLSQRRFDGFAAEAGEGTSGLPSPPNWGEQGERLAQLIGPAGFAQWFGGGQVELRPGPPIQLVADKPFRRKWIAEHFAAQLATAFGSDVMIVCATDVHSGRFIPTQGLADNG